LRHGTQEFALKVQSLLPSFVDCIDDSGRSTDAETNSERIIIQQILRFATYRSLLHFFPHTRFLFNCDMHGILRWSISR
jgi:hypothetical protein